MTEFHLREPAPQDAEALGRAHVKIWQFTYSGMMDEAKLSGMQPDSRVAAWRDRIIPGLGEQARRGVITRCAVDVSTGHIAGFGTGGAARDEDPPRATELWSLNVLPEYHGAGAAAQLLDVLVGDQAAYLWVASQNQRAIAFYRKHGFELDGVTKYDADWACHESRMVRG